MRCEAIDWSRKDADYLECSQRGPIRLYQLEGLLLTVKVRLCDAHAVYFADRPPGWGLVNIYEIKED